MGQKIHPFGFRLGITKKHRSHWFAPKNQYPQLILEDNFLRSHLLSNYVDAGITTIEIQRKLNQVKLEIRAARPGILFGRDGKSLENLRKDLEQKLKIFRQKNYVLLSYSTISNYYCPSSGQEGQEGQEGQKLTTKKLENSTNFSQIAVHVMKLANPGLEAAFIADFLVEQLEKRIAFRRAIRQAVQRAKRSGVKGIKIQVSGRLNGAEIARNETVRQGRVPLHTLRADIDYCYKTAKTIYGLLGIKIWVFKGEISSSSFSHASNFTRVKN